MRIILRSQPNFPREDQKAVSMIKAIRWVTDCSLKDAKRVVDDSRDSYAGEINTKHFVRRSDLVKFQAEALQYGFEASIAGTKDYSEYLEEFRTIASTMILAGDDDIAADVIELIQRYHYEPPENVSA